MQSWWDTQKDIGKVIVRISSIIWNDEEIKESDEEKRVSNVEPSHLRQLCGRSGSCFRSNSHRYSVSQNSGRKQLMLI